MVRYGWIAVKGRGDYDNDGIPVRMMGVVLDITDRKRAEEEINRRQAQLAEAQRIAHIGSYEWDLRTNTVYRSEELCAIFGLNPAEFPPTFEAYLDRVHPEDRSATKATIEQAFRERQPFAFEERIICPMAQCGCSVVRVNGCSTAAGDLMQTGRGMSGCDGASAGGRRASPQRRTVPGRGKGDKRCDLGLGSGQRSVWSNESITTLFNYPVETVGSDIHWFRQHTHPDDVERVISGIRTVMDKGEQFWSGEYRVPARGRFLCIHLRSRLCALRRGQKPYPDDWRDDRHQRARPGL